MYIPSPERRSVKSRCLRFTANEANEEMELKKKQHKHACIFAWYNNNVELNAHGVLKIIAMNGIFAYMYISYFQLELNFNRTLIKPN